MKKWLINFGGLILFYAVIIFGVLLLNMRFSYLNSLMMRDNCKDISFAFNKRDKINLRQG